MDRGSRRVGNAERFTIQFHGREFKVHFDNPKLIGDGKCFLQLLNLPCDYCYLCYILSEKAQSSKRLDNPGFKIDRTIENMWKEVKDLKKEWREADTNKNFTAYFSAKRRKYMIGYPTIKANGFSIENVPH